MITIEYSPEGIAVADHEAEAFVQNLINKQAVLNAAAKTPFDIPIEAKVSTENIIFAARAMKKETDFEIQFKFKDKILVPNADGRLAECPDGFSDHFDNWLMRLF